MKQYDAKWNNKLDSKWEWKLYHNMAMWETCYIQDITWGATYMVRLNVSGTKIWEAMDAQNGALNNLE